MVTIVPLLSLSPSLLSFFLPPRFVKKRLSPIFRATKRKHSRRISPQQRRKTPPDFEFAALRDRQTADATDGQQEGDCGVAHSKQVSLAVQSSLLPSAATNATG